MRPEPEQQKLLLLNTIKLYTFVGVCKLKIYIILKNIQFKLIKFNSPEYWSWVRVREIVLRLPLDMRFNIEDLKKEANEIIAVIYDGEKIIGGAQLVVENDKAKMRQVAVLNSYRQLGIGSLLLDFLETYCKSSGIKHMYCHARETAVAFYLNNQYQKIGEMLFEVGLPHYKMSKDLS